MKEKKDFIVPIAFVFVVLLLVIYNKVIVQKKYKEKGRYTIGIVDDYNTAKGGAYVVSFHYYVDNKIYNEFSNVGSVRVTKKCIGKKYLVMYVLNDEKMSYIDINIPIPDSVKFIPPKGWEEKPIWAK
jgi:hypothetical protein